MTKLIVEMDLYAEEGQENEPCKISFRIDGTKMNTPISFLVDGKSVFSMGSDEVDAFCDALAEMVP